jgi:hypothetical protein
MNEKEFIEKMRKRVSEQNEIRITSTTGQWSGMSYAAIKIATLADEVFSGVKKETGYVVIENGHKVTCTICGFKKEYENPDDAFLIAHAHKHGQHQLS